MTLYLTHDYWVENRPNRLLIALEGNGPDEIVGFGRWRVTTGVHTPEPGQPPQVFRWLFIPFFGVARRWQGQCDDAGHKISDRLYASVEQDALDHAGGPMFIELPCHRDNQRGLRFWHRQGFEDLGPTPHDAAYRRLMLWPGGEPAPDWLRRAVRAA